MTRFPWAAPGRRSAASEMRLSVGAARAAWRSGLSARFAVPARSGSGTQVVTMRVCGKDYWGLCRCARHSLLHAAIPRQPSGRWSPDQPRTSPTRRRPDQHLGPRLQRGPGRGRPGFGGQMLPGRLGSGERDKGRGTGCREIELEDQATETRVMRRLSTSRAGEGCARSWRECR